MFSDLGLVKESVVVDHTHTLHHAFQYEALASATERGFRAGSPRSCWQRDVIINLMEFQELRFNAAVRIFD